MSPQSQIEEDSPSAVDPEPESEDSHSKRTWLIIIIIIAPSIYPHHWLSTQPIKATHVTTERPPHWLISLKFLFLSTIYQSLFSCSFFNFAHRSLAFWRSASRRLSSLLFSFDFPFMASKSFFLSSFPFSFFDLDLKIYNSWAETLHLAFFNFNFDFACYFHLFWSRFAFLFVLCDVDASTYTRMLW